jgi:hypothetical protein
MTIKHNWLTKHKYSLIAIPHDVADKLPPEFELQQSDGSKIKVQYIGRWANHRIDNAPEAFTKVGFGIDTQQMKAALQRAWPELTRQTPENQLISYVAVERV